MLFERPAEPIIKHGRVSAVMWGSRLILPLKGRRVVSWLISFHTAKDVYPNIH